jgi:hypothetical protein
MRLAPIWQHRSQATREALRDSWPDRAGTWPARAGSQCGADLAHNAAALGRTAGCAPWTSGCESRCNNAANALDAPTPRGRSARPEPVQRTGADALDARSRSPKRKAAGSSPAGCTAKVLVDVVQARGSIELRCTSSCNGRPSSSPCQRSLAAIRQGVCAGGRGASSFPCKQLGHFPVETSRASSGTCAGACPRLAASDQSAVCVGHFRLDGGRRRSSERPRSSLVPRVHRYRAPPDRAGHPRGRSDDRRVSTGSGGRRPLR